MTFKLNEKSKTGVRFPRGRNCILSLPKMHIHSVYLPPQGTAKWSMYATALEYFEVCRQLEKTVYRIELIDALTRATGYERAAVHSAVTSWLDDKDTQGRPRPRLFDFTLNSDLPIGKVLDDEEHDSIIAMVIMGIRGAKYRSIRLDA